MINIDTTINILNVFDKESWQPEECSVIQPCLVVTSLHHNSALMTG